MLTLNMVSDYLSIHQYKFVGGTMASTLERALARNPGIKMCLANFTILSRGSRNAPSGSCYGNLSVLMTHLVHMQTLPMPTYGYKSILGYKEA